MIGHDDEWAVDEVVDMGPCVDESDVGVYEGMKTGAGVQPGGSNAASRVGHCKFESRTSNGSEETPLVAEVDVWRLVAHTDPLRYLADTQLFRRLRFEQFQRGGDEPTRQLCPVMHHVSSSD